MLTRLLLAAEIVLVCALSPSAYAEGLTLAQALSLAEQNNPSIAAARLAAESSRAGAKGVRALPAPEIEIAPTISGEAGSDAAIAVSQALELNGTRAARGRAAGFEADSAAFAADTVRRGVLLDVTALYWEIVAAQQTVRLNEENVAYLEALRTATQKQVDIGSIPGSQLLKAEVELSLAVQLRTAASLQLNRLRSTLNSLLGNASATDLTCSDPLPKLDPPVGREALIASALANRPEAAEAESSLRGRQEEIRLSRLLTVPDMSIVARREDFDSGTGVAVVLNLTVVDWGAARAERKRATLAAQAKEREIVAVRTGIALGVEQAILDLEVADQAVRGYEGGILEKSETLARMAQKGYEAGAAGYLDVLEAQRTLREVRAGYYEALASRAIAAAKLEWAVGGKQ